MLIFMRIQIIIIKVQHMEFLPRFLHFKLNVQNHLQVQTTHKIKWEIFYLNMETARREFVFSGVMCHTVNFSSGFPQNC